MKNNSVTSVSQKEGSHLSLERHEYTMTFFFFFYVCVSLENIVEIILLNLVLLYTSYMEFAMWLSY